MLRSLKLTFRHKQVLVEIAAGFHINGLIPRVKIKPVWFVHLLETEKGESQIGFLVVLEESGKDNLPFVTLDSRPAPFVDVVEKPIKGIKVLLAIKTSSLNLFRGEPMASYNHCSIFFRKAVS